MPLFKGMEDKSKCLSYRGISLLSVLFELYERVVIEAVVECTDY